MLYYTKSMLTTFLYIFSIFTLIVFLLCMIAYTLSLFYSSFMGSPYVPTKQKELEFILKESDLQKGNKFLEIGCGDGRVVRTAVKKYNVEGEGIDINPLIIRYARFLARMQKISCNFFVQNLFDTNYRTVDYIYLFLMPDLLTKLLPTLGNQVKKNTIVISHGFKLVDWEQYLYKTIPHRPFPTYFYKYGIKT